eukprot:352544-Chlamydomonas_euryale.AAC.14
MARSAVLVAIVALGVSVAVYHGEQIAPLVEKHAPAVKLVYDMHVPEAVKTSLSDAPAQLRGVVLQARSRVEQMVQFAQSKVEVEPAYDTKAPKAACGIAGKWRSSRGQRGAAVMSDACKCLLDVVAGCDCDFASTESLIQHELKPILAELVQLPFFRFFKVGHWQKRVFACLLACEQLEFAQDMLDVHAIRIARASTCMSVSGSMLTFAVDRRSIFTVTAKVPEPWRKEVQHQLADRVEDKAAHPEGGRGCSDPISPVDRSVGAAEVANLNTVRNWSGLNNPWVPEDDQDVDFIYVNLQLNPERYTGYKGEDARRIWQSIYAQSAFDDVHGHDLVVNPQVLEKQILYRLISGMHSSITTSVIQNYYNETSGEWGPNLPFFKARFVGDNARPYVENLYFTFLFMLRSVMKAGPVLQSFDYNTGFPEEDILTRQKMQLLERSPALLASCKAPFDEGVLWQAREGAERELLEEQLQVAFHNITKLMDCVGCEKCKMWGKLQMLGIATSLKIMFSASGDPREPLQLHRNEVIALVNMLNKLADSVETVRQLSLVVAEEQAR